MVAVRDGRRQQRRTSSSVSVSNSNSNKMEFEGFFVLDEFERKINDEFRGFLDQFDPDFAAQYPMARLSNDLSKGDFSIMLKGVASQKSAINEDELKGLPPKEQKAKKVQLQAQYADKFTSDLLVALEAFIVCPLSSTL